MALTLTKQQLESIEAEMDRLGVREVYDEMVENGTSPRMAGMLAARRPPSMRGTDSQFQKKEQERMKGMDEENREAVLAIAKRAGIDTTGKTYNGQLGKYDDPHAWVADTHDVVEAAKAKKLDIKGDVNVQHAGDTSQPLAPAPLADDIVDRIASEKIASDPQLAEKVGKSDKAMADLKGEVREQHTPRSKQ